MFSHKPRIPTFTHTRNKAAAKPGGGGVGLAEFGAAEWLLEAPNPSGKNRGVTTQPNPSARAQPLLQAQ